MKFRLAVLDAIVLTLVWSARLLAQDDPLPFATNPVATFHFAETVRETLDADDNTVYKGALHITGRVSLAGVNPGSIAAETEFSLTVGDLSLDTTLAGGTSDDSVGAVLAGSIAEKTLTFRINSSDSDHAGGLGTLKITWTDAEMDYAIDLTNASSEFSVAAQALADALDEEPNFQDSTTLDLDFAGRELAGRTVDISGTAAVVAGPDDTTLARDNVSGDMDSTSPKVAITNPANGAVVHQDTISLVGTASDAHLADISVSVNGADPVEATMDDEGNGWTFDDVTLQSGTNVITATAVDDDGNQSSVVQTIQFLPVSDLTVSATGAGAGTITSAYFPPLVYSGQGTPETRVAPSRVEGGSLTVTAVPALPGSFFGGWSSVPPLLPGESADAPKLVFTMQPGQVLTAHFLANPFLGKAGRFSGLVESSVGGPAGFLTLKLNERGIFTGRLVIGALAIPLKGTLSSGLSFSATFVVAKTPYVVSLSLAALPSGAQQLVGSVKGGLIDSTIAADLATFVKLTHPAPQAGVYNVLLPAASGNDANFPAGIGYGRVTVSAAGLATFVGKLGDGTSVSRGSTISADGVWPFFAPLYGKRGWISGEVTFDLAHPDHDLAGTLDWVRPAPLPGDFAGQSELVGAKYARPLAGPIFLNPSAGVGVLTLAAPDSYLAAKQTELPAFVTEPDLDVTLQPAELGNAVTVSDSVVPARAFGAKVTIIPGTGFFSGSFIDATQENAVIKFRGVVVAGKVAGSEREAALKVNAAGGLFFRGDRTGSVQITPPVPPAAE